MKTVYLDSAYKGYPVSDDVYQQIEALVKSNRLCKHCRKPYTDENPQVAFNTCKTCFLRSEGKQYGLSFLGPVEPLQDGEGSYRFIDPGGYMYVSHSLQEANHFSYNKSIPETLKYWQFPMVPTTYEYKGETIHLHGSYLSIYGDVKRNSVVCVEFAERHSYDPDVVLLFLAYQGEESIKEFSKRKGETRKLWLTAKARAEATKDAHGDYHLYGHSHSWLAEYDLYRLVADIASEERDQQPR
jgi:hypothetical protein